MSTKPAFRTLRYERMLDAIKARERADDLAAQAPALLKSAHKPPPPLPDDVSPAKRIKARNPPATLHLGRGMDRDVFPRPMVSFGPHLNQRWLRQGQCPFRVDPKRDEANARPWWWQPPLLGPFELIVMLSLQRFGDCAYGAAVHAQLEHSTDQPWSLRAVYSTLQRLEAKDYVHSAPRPWNGWSGPHKRRRMALTALGCRALRTTLGTYDELRPVRRPWTP